MRKPDMRDGRSHRPEHRPCRTGAMVIMMVALTGCSLPFAGRHQDVDVALSDTGRLHYVTDRASHSETSAPMKVGAYGGERSQSMAYGVLMDREDAAPAVREVVRFPATPLEFTMRGGRPVTLPADAAAYAAATRRFTERIAAALRESRRSDVVMTVHGVNTNFAEAMAATATVWRATDRAAVPVAFSWPARDAGLLSYFTDRESGEFAIHHLKETLRLLADIPHLERLHIVAHSRGTDVATTALREMVIAARASGRDPRRALKVENLILAAPDLDFDVVRQRLIAERFGPAIGRITVYMNEGDEVLALAQALMKGTRFGRLSHEDLGDAEREIFKRIRNVDFVSVGNVVGRNSHGYFRRNPAVLSDMKAILRFDAPPDGEGRYLTADGGNFWLLENPPRIQGPVRTASR